MNRRLPKDFKLGAAISAYQAEGACTRDGRGKCYWDSYLETQGSFSPDTASAFYEKYEEDIAMCKLFNIKYLRVSISWSRIFPSGSKLINQKGVEFYHKVFDCCLKHGVEPLVSLHHFDTPLTLFNEGDWLSRKTIDAFHDYAKYCFREFGKKVKYWVTINEAYSVAAGQYIIGHFPPNQKYEVGKAIQAMHNMMVAHAKVVNSFKEMNTGKIGVIHILESKYPISSKIEDVRASEIEHILCNGLLLDATIYGEYQTNTLDMIHNICWKYHHEFSIETDDFECMKKAAPQLDFLGVNYYQSHFVEAYNQASMIHHNGSGSKGTSIYALSSIGKHMVHPDVERTDWDWSIYPKGLFDMIMRIHDEYNFNKEIMVTENGIGIKEELGNDIISDDIRIDYVNKHLLAVVDAIEQGANVTGYYIWSLYDVLSWTNGYSKRYGLFYIDFDTQIRIPKKSAYWYKRLVETKELDV